MGNSPFKEVNMQQLIQLLLNESRRRGPTAKALALVAIAVVVLASIVARATGFIDGD
jgi:type IV secretory pathway VirB2 component (pilin)